ncbi:MAG: ROK family glucokinase [Actinomycetaceae bacterium]|nr:ROK family glucokinase [Actinomycetaceae bacterium]
MSYTIGVDVGGTKIAAGVVNESGEVLRSARTTTPATEVDAVATTIANLVEQLRGTDEILAVGVGAAGFCDATRSQVVYAPNLAWRNEPLRERIEGATGLPTVVENDANAAAWGEFRFGAAKEADSAIVVTLGTGIGGGIIVNNQLVRGFQGFAGEIGHMEIKAGGRRCGCGLRGCWERYGSGTALVHEAREIATVAPAQAGRLLELAGGKAQDINGQMVTQAAQEGDPIALDVIDTVARWVGRGLANLVAVLDPQMIVLAGGVASAGETLREPVERAFDRHLTARLYRQAPRICLAQLGVPAGLIGAADLARL